MTAITRKEWGAKYADGFRDAPVPYTGIVLHHSVTIAPDLVPPWDDDYAAVRQLEKIGQDRFGGGISYTWAVTPIGLVFQGHSVGRQGAHTKGLNSSHRAVVLVGDCQRNQVTTQQVAAIAGLCAEEYKAGRSKALGIVGGHGQMPGNAGTECPGTFGLGVIPLINSQAVAWCPNSSPADIPTIQKAVGAEPDGIWGEDTDRRCEAVRVGTPVKALQSYLDIKADGVYGPATLAAHNEARKGIQRGLHVAPDGIWGASTQQAYVNASPFR